MDPRDLRLTTLAVPGGDLEARFAAGAGMVCCSLTHQGTELLGVTGGVEAYLARGKTFGIPLLYPWANRLGAWGYAAAGRTVELDRDSPLLREDAHGLPIHGALARGLHWEVAGLTSGDGPATLEAALDWTTRPELLAVFPFPHRLVLAVSVTEDTLRVATTVHATGDDAVPLSFGFHPYLAPAGAPRPAWAVELPALTHLALGDDGVPTGARAPLPAEAFTLGERTYDDLFALADPSAAFVVADGVRRVTIAFEDGFTHAQVFAPPDRDVICFEPMTAPVDALRSHDGLRTVAPGTSATATFSVRVEPA